MRAFLAFPIPREDKDSLFQAAESGKKLYRDVKWIKRENFHITLLFLGNLDEGLREQIDNSCKRVASQHRSFEVSFRGVGQFPPKGRPRVIYSPITLGEEFCVSIHADIVSELEGLLNPDTRRYSPHITIGRVRKGRKAAPVSTLPRLPEGNFLIDRIVLYQSVLQAEGPVYNEITSYGLQS